MELSGVKKIDVQAIIIRADGSQEDLGIVSSWESNSNKNTFKNKMKRRVKWLLP